MAFDEEKELSEKELQILYGELNENKKSVGVCYLLFIFMGGLGVHKFYLGGTLTGLIYLACFVTGWLLYVPWFFLGLGLLIDLFTIPMQVNEIQKKRKKKIIQRLKKG